MIVSCNSLEGYLIAPIRSKRTKKIPSVDSNVDDRSASFSAPNLTGSNDETRQELHPLLAFRD